jgi:hypothetical protein
MSQYIYDPTDESVYEVSDEDVELEADGFWFADAADPDHEYFYEFLPEEVEFELEDE